MFVTSIHWVGVRLLGSRWRGRGVAWLGAPSAVGSTTSSFDSIYLSINQINLRYLLLAGEWFVDYIHKRRSLSPDQGNVKYRKCCTKDSIINTIVNFLTYTGFISKTVLSSLLDIYFRVSPAQPARSSHLTAALLAAPSISSMLTSQAPLSS